MNDNSSVNWELTFDKFLNRNEIEKLRKWVLERKTANPDERVANNDWFVVECLLNTGLRVAELADLKCGDIIFRNELSCVVVREGKGGKSREVMINRDFQDEALEYLDWKKVHGEKVSKDDVILYSPKSKGRYSTRALQFAFKRCLVGAKISLKHSIHHLRHTYASLLLSASKNNLPLVQKQLGHSSVVITQVYTKVFKEEIKIALDHLF
jgi:integrase/recombinase XerD